jgi:uncharacterized tellurite resistance protein B-like protein
MFESLKEKYNRLTDKKNVKSVAKYFQDPGYIQDKKERNAQILFYKLLMIAAYSDNSVDENELNLIKDYIYEQCLTEQEWREVDYFGHVKPSVDEMNKIYEKIAEEVQSASDKKELLNAIKEVIATDEILKDEEKVIFETLEKKVKKINVSVIGNVIRRIKVKTVHDSASEFVKNPIFPILKKYLADAESKKLEIVAAKLGLVLVLIHSDMEFHEKEKEAFKEIVKDMCDVNEEKTERFISEIISIPDDYFEISYLSRIMVDNTQKEERIELLATLFRIARADDRLDGYEDKYIRIISNSLLLDHKDFIAIKNRK